MEIFDFVTYMCSAVTCLVLGILLLILPACSSQQTPSCIPIKRFVAYGVFLDVVVNLFCAFLIYVGEDIHILDDFFVPVIYFLQMAFIGLALLFSLTDKRPPRSYYRKLLLPLLVLIVLYIVCWGLEAEVKPFTIMGYQAFLSTEVAYGLRFVSYAVVIVGFLLVTYRIFRALQRFRQQLHDSFDYVQYNRLRRLRFLIYSFTIYFSFAALDFICFHYWFDLLMVWLGIVFFTCIVILYYYMEYHFEGRKSAVTLSQKVSGYSALSEMATQAEPQGYISADLPADSVVKTPLECATGERAGTTSQSPVSLSQTTPSVDIANIADILQAWSAREDKPFMKEGVTLVDTAESMHVHPRLLSGYLNMVYHVNFNTWINQLRIDELKRLLVEQPDRTLNDLSHDAGFTDSSAMSKVFKKITGELPSHYRNRMLHPGEE